MGSVGDAYDNAMAESFFATLECELLRTYGASAPSHNHGLDLMWSLVDVLIRGVSR